MSEDPKRLATNADVLVAALQDRGIDYLFANAGTDWAPVVEALVSAREAGRAVPEFMIVPHENAAMAMAQGYYLATGRPQAVGVHNNVGTANALCGLMNAARDNIPLLLIAGRTPYSETGSIASREVIVHWAQENFDQAGIVREHVKWDYELKSNQDLTDVIDRALDIAMTAPRGPVYLTLPREVLVEPAATTHISPRRRPFGAEATQPHEPAIETLAGWVAAAEMPLIITSVAGRDERAVNALSLLAERFAVPVVQCSPRAVNLPDTHPMHMGYQPDVLLGSADLVLVVDCEVPWIRRYVAPAARAKVAHIGVDPLYITYPLRCFEDDLAIAGASAYALPLLIAALDRLGAARNSRVAERRTVIAGKRAALRAAWQAARAAARTETPLSPLWIAAAIDGIRDHDTIIVNETGLCLEQTTLDKPGSLFIAPPVGGLGWALGAALGIRMGAPDKTVIVLLGDGSYMFGNPTPCHYIAAAHGLPILIVVANNSGWKAVDRAVRAVYPDGRAVRSGAAMPLVDITPSPAFEKIVEASGGYGERVDDPAQIGAALARALHAVRVEKRQALLNIVSQ